MKDLKFKPSQRICQLQRQILEIGIPDSLQRSHYRGSNKENHILSSLKSYVAGRPLEDGRISSLALSSPAELSNYHQVRDIPNLILSLSPHCGLQ